MKTGTSFRVNFRDYERNSLLAEAFSNPRMLHREQNYIANNSHFAVATVPSDIGSRLEDQKVVVIRRVLNKEKIAWLLVMILVMSLCVGTVAHTAQTSDSLWVLGLSHWLLSCKVWLDGFRPDQIEPL